MPRLADLLTLVDGWYPPGWAEPWDAVGLTCGDPDEPVRTVLLAVDAVPATVEEAVAAGAGLLLTHHPLLLGAVHGVPATDPKGALVHRMVRAGVAHLAVHTNADAARPGVSDALAARLGVGASGPLEPLEPLAAAGGDEPLLKLVVFVPQEATARVVAALTAAGAGALGDYDRCTWTVAGTGAFRPLPGAHPALGRVGETASVAEDRVETVVPPARLAGVLAALRAAHPYEQPAFDVVATLRPPAPPGTARGTGRVGDLAARTTLGAFVRLVAQRVPASAWGVRAAGEPDRPVRRVAVCGGSGGGLADAARRAGADVLVTADLKHHATLEAVTERGPGAMALVDAGHWSTEAPWLDELAARLRGALGTTVEVRVSRQPTDPWGLWAPPGPPAHPTEAST